MTTVSIINSTFPFIAGTQYKFINPITILVGDIGAGKSSMLKLIGTNDSATSIMKSCSNVIWWDSEFSNPRTRNYEILDYWMQFVTNTEIPDDRKMQIAKLVQEFLVLNKEDSTVTCSHGEKLFPILTSINSHPGSLILLDEPDTGLSIQKIQELYTLMKDTLVTGSEYIIATHSPVLMELAGTVFNISTGEYVDSTLYLNSIWNK